MGRVLAALGTGEYCYGWELSLEPPRGDQITALPGVEAELVEPLIVQYVDFSGWPDWDQYWRSVSENSRRNYKKAVANLPGLTITRYSGLSLFAAAPRLAQLRRQSLSRKDKKTAIAGDLLRILLRGLRGGYIQLVADGETAYAALSAEAFAGKTYYFEGGTVQDNKGAGWYLLLEALKHVYGADRTARFIMGNVWERTADNPHTEGLCRSRRACGATDHQTDLVWFRYTAPRPV